jgi:hypothetical protein
MLWPDFVGSLNGLGDIGHLGIRVSFCWNNYDGRPRNIKIGDVIDATYNDGTFLEKSSTVVTEYEDKSGYFAQFDWGIDLPHYSNLTLYTFTIRN